jgi:hypothetical protein
MSEGPAFRTFHILKVPEGRPLGRCSGIRSGAGGAATTMILDQLRGTRESVMRGKLGFACLCTLYSTGVTAFFVAHRPDQYCFAPPVHNWAYRLLQVCLLAEACAAALALVGLLIDKDKIFAIVTLVSFPLILIADGLAMGCN